MQYKTVSSGRRGRYGVRCDCGTWTLAPSKTKADSSGRAGLDGHDIGYVGLELGGAPPIPSVET